MILKVYFSFSLCLLVIFAGGRWSSLEVGYDVGIFDYGTYKNIYNAPLNIVSFFSDYKDSSWEIRGTRNRLCVLFIIMLLLYLEIILISICCLLIFLLVVLFYKSMKQNGNKNRPFLFCFFAARLYLQYNFILLRQAIAMTIIWMWAFPFLLRKEK